ncbi:MAG: SDR family NAD(P)-dependent oxidoreductase [Candidatus Binatus sp.]|uniref:SDR family NAD(P)-dependent oxidoreductase n=1 Tax=Candidatus Binatus sp. TaxID=2811406 RepID=UPI003C70E3F9
MKEQTMAGGILDLKGRIGLVTGAGQGVGRQIALHLAANGAGGVVVNDYYEERAKAVAAEVEKLGCKGLASRCDVTDFAGVMGAFEQAVRALGRVDILVNNAGNYGPDPRNISRKPFWEQSPNEWQPALQTNFFGVLNCTRAALPGMIERTYGRIVTVISDAGRVGEPNLEIYSGAKAGAAGFIRAIAKDVGRYSITANCVALGTTRTPTTARMLEVEEYTKKVLRHYPIRRLGEPEDAANMVLFLASDASSWMTGQTIPVNGGYSFAV